jgi:hypothetical protein
VSDYWKRVEKEAEEARRAQLRRDADRFQGFRTFSEKAKLTRAERRRLRMKAGS